MSWRDRTEPLCYAGERVEREFDLDGRALVVTSHRLVAFASDAGESAVRTVDRPTVAGVRVEAEGRGALLRWAVLVAVGGVALLALSASVDFAAPVESVNVDDGGAVAPGIAGTVESITAWLSLLDAAVRWGGVLGCIGSLALFGFYLRSRTRRLVVAVRGEADLDLPLSRSSGVDTGAIEAAIRPDAAGVTGANFDDGPAPNSGTVSGSPDEDVIGPYPDPGRGDSEAGRES